MNQGFYLTLMVGSFTADPVPQAVIDALTTVNVTTAIGQQGGFDLSFTYAKSGPLAQLLMSGYFDPRRRVIIAVTVNGSTEVLMDGIITKQDLTPSSQAGKSTLKITGIDLTELMDFIDLTGIPYPALPMFAIVELILAKYLVLGVVPLAIPPIITTIQNPIEKSLKQVGTDYAYVTQLANQTGSVFYLDPGPEPGMSLAYWGPDLTKIFSGTQPALSIDLDATTNVDSLSFSYDGTVSKQYFVTILIDELKVPIPIPVPSIDQILPFHAAHAAARLKTTPLLPISHKKPWDAALEVLGKLTQIADAVTGSGTLDVTRYGQTLKARQLCAVRGAGDYYDGIYYVKSVSHAIKRGEYKQNFSLGRGGYGSTIDTVSA
ncbi:MAG TPA: hypothetical protein VGD01_11695 [Candidatus Elarobacter sp.]